MNTVHHGAWTAGAVAGGAAARADESERVRSVRHRVGFYRRDPVRGGQARPRGASGARSGGGGGARHRGDPEPLDAVALLRAVRPRRRGGVVRSAPLGIGGSAGAARGLHVGSGFVFPAPRGRPSGRRARGLHPQGVEALSSADHRRDRGGATGRAFLAAARQHRPASAGRPRSSATRSAVCPRRSAWRWCAPTAVFAPTA